MALALHVDAVNEEGTTSEQDRTSQTPGAPFSNPDFQRKRGLEKITRTAAT